MECNLIFAVTCPGAHQGGGVTQRRSLPESPGQAGLDDSYYLLGDSAQATKRL